MSNQKEDQAMLVQVEALSRALKLLVAAGCEYAVIDASGVKHGALEVVAKKANGKKPRNHPPGSYLIHHKPLTGAMLAGESRVVPYGPFTSEDDRESLRSSISAFCCREWGSGTYITAAAPGGVEVLRVE